MNDKAQQDIETTLRAQAEESVKNEFDPAAMLEKFKAEARAKLESDMRSRATDAVRAEQPNVDAFGFPKRYFKINIYRGQGKKELSYIPVGVNGYVFKLERGVDLMVPSVVLDALNDAVTEDVIQSDGGLITRPVHRFQYQNLGAVTEAEYKAFKEKMNAAGAKTAAAA